MKELTQKDLPRIRKYIMKEPEVNLFFIGDLENFSLDDEKMDVFAQERNGDWDFLILRYFDSYLVYSDHEDYDAKAAADFLSGRNGNIISGKGEIMERLHPFLPERQVEGCRLCRLREVAFCPPLPAEAEIRRLKPEDAPEIVSLYLQIAEFRGNYAGRADRAAEEIRSNLECGGRSYGAFRNGKLTSIVSTTAENSVSAMVVGVATLPEARGLGLASRLVADLCREVLSDGRQFLCLFYDNPQAGKIYFKIGFADIGSYAMLKKSTNPKE